MNLETLSLYCDVIRSGSRADFVGGTATCVLTNDPGTQVTDSGIPAVSGVYYYLARGRDACGPGVAGTNSSGVPIATRSCP